jgi:hypothetical protein
MPVNYQLGKIYTIVNDIDNTVYVGSSSQYYLSSRWGNHVRRALDLSRTSPIYVAMRQHGAGHFSIRLHHAFACKSKDELIAEEYATLEAIIAKGTPVYNRRGKGDTHAMESKLKISESTKGAQSHRFTFGGIRFENRSDDNRWLFQWCENEGMNPKSRKKSFGVAKFGYYGAHFRAEEARRAMYPDWGNDEDIYCDDLGHIEWD